MLAGALFLYSLRDAHKIVPLPIKEAALAAL
jgi:hypothetical protein